MLLPLVCAHVLVAQSVDSLFAAANAPGLGNKERVLLWHGLLRDLSTSEQQVMDLPAGKAVLADTSKGDSSAWLLNGDLLSANSAFERSALAYRKAMDRFEAQGDEVGYAIALNALAHMRSILGDQAAAMRNYFEALSILQRTGPALDEAQALLGLAFIFRYQEDHDKATEYYGRALAIGRATGAELVIVDGLRGIGGIMVEREQLDSARAVYEEAVAFAERVGNARRMAILRVELANIHIKRGQFSDAEREYLGALTSFEQRNNMIWVSYTLARLAETAHQRGDEQAALRYGERGLAIAKEWGLLKESLDNLFVLPEVNASLGRYKEALELSRAFEALYDTMRSDATATELARLEIQQEQVRDSLAHEEQRVRESIAFDASVEKARTQRNLFLFIGLAVLLLVGGLWGRLRHTRRVGRELAEGNALIEKEVQRAERSEKVKEQFLANMSHEIRTPMNAIMGMTAILRRNEHMPEQDRYLDAIAQSSSNLLVILNDILDLGKLEAGKVELEQVPFDPRAVLGNVLDILRFKAEEKGLKLELHVAEEVHAEVVGDPTRLNQIILNLVGNAIKFTEKGGVAIHVSVVDPEPAADDRVLLRYEVRDTGIGIRKERIDKVFEEFTQAYSDTTRKYGGTGLGLTITKRLVELQQGTITVESVPDRGSSFFVTIPYTRSAGPVSTEAPAASDPVMALDGIRILLAEDNDFNVMVATDGLNDAIPGVHVEVAANGRIAVEKATAEHYDVILMDIQMPEMNGFEATEAIRKLPGDAGRVPIIAMTANVLKSEVDRSKAVGMNGFVPKPFDRADFLKELARAITERRGST